ncbi:MAG TPA: DUF1641 domain-containing protein [Anaerolineae bacterium]|nr:DUF1641 domain-containing protein [Caldilineae bacterium]HID34418.1 DUF1641 domain-containing protein [Anaerolineae bacterium]HIQ11573.1 DUF1641 domain-containing protein [Caldilineales bacterium]
MAENTPVPVQNDVQAQLQALNAKLDALTEQVAVLTDFVLEQRQRQQEWDELKEDLTPIGMEMFAAAVEELEEVEPYAQLEDILFFLKRLVTNLHNFEAMFDQLESFNDLFQDLTPIANDAFLVAVDQLEEMEKKGYFQVIPEAKYILDNVVDAFGPEDVRALGDNIVLILSTVRSMTQPEIMTLVQQLTESTQEAVRTPDEELDISYLGLLRQMRDPQIRLGLARTMRLLRAMGDIAPPAPSSDNGHAQ